MKIPYSSDFAFCVCYVYALLFVVRELITFFFKMGRHIDLQLVLDYHRDGVMPAGFDKDQRKNLRISAEKFLFDKGKLYRKSKRSCPLPGAERVLVILSKRDQLDVTRREHR